MKHLSTTGRKVGSMGGDDVPLNGHKTQRYVCKVSGMDVPFQNRHTNRPFDATEVHKPLTIGAKPW